MSSRYRKQNEIDIDLPGESSISYYNGNPTINSTTSQKFLSEFAIDEMWDHVGNNGSFNPCYRSKINNYTGIGNLFATSGSGASRVDLTRRGNLVEWFLTEGGVYSGKKPELDFVTLIPTLPELKLKALSSIDKTPYQFGEDVAEIKGTVDLLKNPLGAISDANRFFDKSLKRVLNGKSIIYKLPSTPGKVIRTVPQLWLMARFVYGNLGHLVNSSMAALQERNRVRPTQRKASSGDFVVVIDRKQESTFTLTYAGTRVATFRKKDSVKRLQRVGLRYHDSSPLKSAFDDLGLRIKDIPVTTWQVMPTSWFIDRFIDVSAGIKAVTNLLDPDISIIDGFESTHDFSVSEISLVSVVNPGWTYSISSNVIHLTSERISRNRWVPSLSDTIPRANISTFNTDATSIVDEAALVIGKIAKNFNHR